MTSHLLKQGSPSRQNANRNVSLQGSQRYKHRSQSSLGLCDMAVFVQGKFEQSVAVATDSTVFCTLLCFRYVQLWYEAGIFMQLRCADSIELLRTLQNKIRKQKFFKCRCLCARDCKAHSKETCATHRFAWLEATEKTFGKKCIRTRGYRKYPSCICEAAGK